jgi:hypothetical protein
MSTAQLARHARQGSLLALVIAVIALFLALGGVGDAATSPSSGVKLAYESGHGSVPSLAYRSVDVRCPSGTRPTGGGFDAYPEGSVEAVFSLPFNTVTGQTAGGSHQTPNAWEVDFYNSSSAAVNVSITAVCASQ